MKTPEEYAILAEAQIAASRRSSGEVAARYIARAAVYAELAKVSAQLDWPNLR